MKSTAIVKNLLIEVIFFTLLVSGSNLFAQENFPLKKILVVFEGSDIPSNYARGHGRQIGALLGHFDTEIALRAANDYKSGELNNFDFTFFVGFSKKYTPPDKLLKDVYATSKPLVFMNTGLEYFSRIYDLKKKFGFTFVDFDTLSNFYLVKFKNKTFPKGEPNCNIIRITNPNLCHVVATAVSERQREVPYIINANNFWYIADFPLSYATENDRYLLFADMLHDLLGELHASIHKALIRIEDVDPLEDPVKLREIADYLYSQQIPFLVAIIPFYVDPSAGLRVSLSEKPEFVDAIHYMMEHGGTVVLHGVTHQYREQTATDFEFWDASINKPIKNDSKEYVEKKLTTGIEECLKNGIYPLLWETPHYAASNVDYSAISKFFSSAIEQRLSMEDLDYSQYFPYVIEKDLYGQKIYPENLGFVPLEENAEKETEYVKKLIEHAKVNLIVRDGYASAFFHPFLKLEFLEQLVTGIRELGYNYTDLRDDVNSVHLKNKAIVSSHGTITLEFQDQYLRETYLNESGQIAKREKSAERINGKFEKEVNLSPGWIYVAEPTEYKERGLTFWQNVRLTLDRLVEKVFLSEREREELRPAILWNPKARGSARNDQASFVAAFRSLNVSVDTIVVKSPFELNNINLLIVPYGVVDSLRDEDYGKIRRFVENGDFLITDSKNDLAEELGIKFTKSFLKIEKLRDKLYPEEILSWNKPESMYKFDVESDDEVLCIDDKTDAPVVIGRTLGRGKFIFFGTRFDPLSDGGYSRFPYLMEYVRKYFNLWPIARRDFLEVYFDPSFHRALSIEQLVKNWRKDGIRVIHIGVHDWTDGKKTWVYDYDRLIKLCHANGILVYAWLEPPQVSQKFWFEHPEWREKNFKGEDIQPSWRFPIALTDSLAMRAVLAQTNDFLAQYDWDGVNLAELYFESGRGPLDPNLLTPMHLSARTEFRKRYGFDPVQLLDSSSVHYWKTNEEDWKKFEEYRVNMITSFHERFLSLIQTLQTAKPGFHLIVTTMDNIASPELRRDHGIDVRRIIELKKKYQFVLQIEDPQTLWSRDPRRYVDIGKRYEKLLGSSSELMLDLNILPFRKPDKPYNFPTLIQTGLESYHLVRSAALVANRLTIYAESSVNPQDLKMFPYALAAKAKVVRVQHGWDIETPYPITLELSKYWREILLDGERHFATTEGTFFIPTGQHSVRLVESSVNPFDTNLLETRILSITANLLSQKVFNRGVEFTYSSPQRCLVTFNREPFALFLDDQEYPIKALKGEDVFALQLPPGEHKVLVIAKSQVSYGVDVTSLWSSSLIVFFGMLSGSVLVIFYIIVRLKRKNSQ